MKTLIDIDENLLKKAMDLSKSRTKKETIHSALQELIRARHRQELISMQGSGLLDLTLDELKTVRKQRTKKHISIDDNPSPNADRMDSDNASRD